MTAPSTIKLTNQFGESSTNFIRGGSSEVYCNFVVDSTNGNGLGQRSLKGYGVTQVYMHTTATPASGNPNPLAGYIWVQLAKTHSSYMYGVSGFASPVSGTPINITSGVTQGQAYIITSVGTSTAANWQAIGVPVGITPAVGVGFVASVTGNGVGTGVVEVPLATGSGIVAVELVGDPNTTNSPSSGGAWVLVQCLAATSSGSTVLKATAPADGTVVGLNFDMGAVPGPVI